jgi:hypothetical protein
LNAGRAKMPITIIRRIPIILSSFAYTVIDSQPVISVSA